MNTVKCGKAVDHTSEAAWMIANQVLIEYLVKQTEELPLECFNPANIVPKNEPEKNLDPLGLFPPDRLKLGHLYTT
jgi:hypothetical protein